MGEEQGKSQGNGRWDSAKKRPGTSHSLSAPKQMGGMNIPNRATDIRKQGVQKGLKKNQQLDHVSVCQGPKGEAVTLKEASKSKDSAPGRVRMTAAGEKTAENFFLIGKYREQETGIFKGKRGGGILRERNSLTARG